MENIFVDLMNLISKINGVKSIGKTGLPTLPLSNESDVDIFIFCDKVPFVDTRQKFYNSINYDMNIQTHEIENKHWGIIDFLYINDLEICLMYYTINKVELEIDDILNGNRVKKEEGYFYPIGRCATLKNINIIYDKDKFLEKMKEKLSVYPKNLCEKNIKFHLSRLNDTEDLDRAVKMQDILFYHFALDISLDHFLQILFSLNYCYFPSRKRSIQFINDFNSKPENCVNDLLEIIELGGNKNTINKSYERWKELCNETRKLLPK